ncbi:hypothetical protein [Oceanicaulis sp. MMSF_3324]|uniref:hypothetical protein n=1 Tax=Oceanicaulis sp. MMSF_3324 TaxID=3046702 RepID=UPI00273EB29C|nr:hypothetical protein [Oceanicaulis sp. MMSF_3324]
MNDTVRKQEQDEMESLDREAQRRREAGADGAEADRVPEPGPSEHKDSEDKND